MYLLIHVHVHMGSISEHGAISWLRVREYLITGCKMLGGLLSDAWLRLLHAHDARGFDAADACELFCVCGFEFVVFCVCPCYLRSSLLDVGVSSRGMGHCLT